MANLSNIQQVLMELKRSYLAEIPERCQHIEALVLRLKRNVDADYESVYQALYRQIHNIKGSAGTHGIEIISSICHQFEELINQMDGKPEKVNDHFINHCLAYIDLVRDAVEQEKQDGIDEEGITQRLQEIHKLIFPNSYRCMIVDSSKSRGELYKKALSVLPINVCVMDNGYYALRPLLKEKYNFLIVSKELPLLNGIALIQALRASGSLNRDIYCVLLSIDTDTIDSESRIAPDCILKKNTHLLDSLVDTIAKRVA